MSKNNCVVAIYPSHTAAGSPITGLQKSGFDLEKLSIVGRDCSRECNAGLTACGWQVPSMR
jgi:hypothetical protein